MRRPRTLLRGTALLFAAACVSLVPGSAHAQAIDRPSDERPRLEPLPEPEKPVAPRVPLELPPVPPPPQAGPFAAGLTVVVSEVRVEGSSVFSAADFRPATEPFAGRKVDSSDLQDLAEAVSAVYIRAGYVSSGAFIPDQDLEGGVLRVQVVEARLVDVVVEGNRWLREGYLRRRLLAAIPAPVRIDDVEEQLQILEQDPDVLRVAGKLLPGPERGSTVLLLALVERSPFGVSAAVANDNPPPIGSVRGKLWAGTRNALGFADPLETRFDFAEGMTSQEVRYEFPVTPWETRVRARFRHTHSEVVQSPFDVADIEAETWTGTLGVQQPVVRTPSTDLALEVLAERRQSTTWLDGDRFEFVPGPGDDGRADVMVLRFVADGSWRSRHDVIAIRSTLSWGLDVWGATSNATNVPDGSFLAWLGQAQWAHRFPTWLRSSQLVVRGDAQLASSPLLSLEQIAVGGMGTVRGYAENLLVRDNAVIASAELRIPVWEGSIGDFELAPFFDWGTAWNEEHTPLPKTIRGAGLGVRYRWSDRIQAYAYWGKALHDVPDLSDDIQEDGFHLGISVRAF